MILSQNCLLQTSKGRTKKLHIQALRYLHFACHLLVLNIWMKFYDYLLNSSKVIKRTQFCQETAT